jgi:hypothetical protein
MGSYKRTNMKEKKQTAVTNIIRTQRKIYK